MGIVEDVTHLGLEYTEMSIVPRGTVQCMLLVWAPMEQLAQTGRDRRLRLQADVLVEGGC